MKRILDFPIEPDQAALWSLGQAGYVIRSPERTVVIDPYLSDSVAKVNPPFSRCVPVPLDPSQLKSDIFIVTHDHLDHLDPETIDAYQHKDTTVFVAPRLASRKLLSLGIPQRNVTTIDCGVTHEIDGTTITGMFAVPTDASVVDTTGYRIEFQNGRSVYHTSDTAYSELLLASAPQAEVLLVCINGKWGNLNAEQGAKLAARVNPRVAIPNHYDVMELNSENPKTFEYFARAENAQLQVRILEMLEPFTWGC